MVEYQVNRSTAYAAVISVALHAGVLLAALGFQAYQPPVDRTSKLLVELAGMIAEQQREEKAPAPTPAKPLPTASPPPPAAVRPQTIRKPAPQRKVAEIPQQDTPHSTDSQVQALPTSEATGAPAVPEQTARTSTTGPSKDFQKQTTIAAQDDSAEKLKRYMDALTKKIRSKLVYPDDVKRAGFEGSPVVKFRITADGKIRPGSLTVVRKSAYRVLDQKAMETIEACEPFELPPQETEVILDVTFSLAD